MITSWTQCFSHRNNNYFCFSQHSINENFKSILINTNKTKPKRVHNTKLILEEEMNELEELQRKNMPNYNNYMNMRNMIMADDESTIH